MPTRDAPPPDPTDPIPTPLAVPRARFRLTLIWIVPLLAVLVGLGLAAKAVFDRGPEILLVFKQAEGLEAGKTRLKYKDVDIGTVTAVRLSENHRSVSVSVQMDKQAEALLVDDSRFWVVRPRIAAGGVSGLSTLLSGAYIAIDPGRSEESRREFVGLEAPPLVVSDMPGRQFLLAAEDLGSLDIGTPVYFRRIPVGRVIGYALRPDGSGVDVRIFVDAPYDKFVTPRTRFWHASGLDLSLGADGIRVNMQSMLSLALGGVAFGLPKDDSESDTPAAADAAFVLHADQAAAMQPPDNIVEKYLLAFQESVRGLAVGAPVDFRGLPAGEVSRIDPEFDRGTSDVVMAVEIKLYPERFARQQRGHGRPGALARMPREALERMVAHGLRAQLRTGNLVSGQRYVALDFFPAAKPARIRWDRRIPELPTQPGTLDSIQDQILAVADVLRSTLERADRLIDGIDRELAPELAATLKDARRTLAQANLALASDSPVQSELRATLRELGRAAQAVRNLADLLERQPEALLTGKKDNR